MTGDQLIKIMVKNNLKIRDLALITGAAEMTVRSWLLETRKMNVPTQKLIKLIELKPFLIPTIKNL